MENLSKKNISSKTQFVKGIKKKEEKEREVLFFCFCFCLSFNPNKRAGKPLTAGSIVKPGNRSASYPNWVGLEIQADFCDRMIACPLKPNGPLCPD